MPTLSISAALLVLGHLDGLPWMCPTWQAITNIAGPPWETPADVAPNAPSMHMTEWTVVIVNSVKVYAQNLWACSLPNQITYSSRAYSNNNTEGQQTWNSFVQQGIHTWKLNNVIDDVFKDCKLSPYDIMAQVKSRSVSAISHVITYTTVHLMGR